MDENLKKKIVADFGLGDMTEADQEKFIERIGAMLFEYVVERAVEVMDEQTMTDFDEVITNAGEDYQKVIVFLKDRVPGFKDIVTDEMSRLKRATSGIFA